MTELFSRTDDRKTDDSRHLPAWPVLALMWGYPVWWVSGLLPFLPLAVILLLGAILVSRGRAVLLPPASLTLTLFVGWTLPTVVMLDSPGRLIGFTMRVSALVAVAVLYVYIANARERLSLNHLLLGMCAVWGLVVVGGVLGALFPAVRLTTPMGLLLPASITSNELVRDLVFPPLAEVQQPWGADEPFNRPAAPFPYTNGWGSAFALSTPVVLAAWLRLGGTRWRVLLSVGFLLSLIPVVASLNRGMFLMLGVAGGYVALRLALTGHVRTLVVFLVAAAATVGALYSAGVGEQIAARQEVSDTTAGRASIYAATLRAVLGSPVLGYGAPRPSEDIGINLGTQGAVWMYLFSYGFVGAILFVLFLLGAIIVTARRVTDTPAAFLHSTLIAALVGAWYYGYDFTQWLIIVTALACLGRQRSRRDLATREALSPRAWAHV